MPVLTALYGKLGWLTKKEQNLLGLLAQVFTENTEENRTSILEIVSCIPSIMNDDKVVIEDELRDRFRKFVKESLQIDVLRTLETASAQGHMSDARKAQLFICFQNWLTTDMKEDLKKALHQLGLINLCFDELYRDASTCSEEASEAIYALLSICNDSGNYLALYNVILNKLKEGLPIFERHLRTREVENVKSYLYIFDGLVRRIFKQMIMRPDSEDIRIILYEVYLKVLKTQSMGLVSLACSSFKALISRLSGEYEDDADDDFEEVEDLNKSSDPKAQLEVRKRFIAHHIPLWKEIVEVCLVQSRMDEDHLRYFDTHSIGTDEDQKDFEDKNNERYDIEILIIKISNMIGFMSTFNMIAPRLSSTLSCLEEEQKGSGKHSNGSLLEFEGELHCVLSLLKSDRITQTQSEGSIVNSVENEEIIKTGSAMVELLLKFPYDNQRVWYTALKIIKRSGGFFGRR